MQTAVQIPAKATDMAVVPWAKPFWANLVGQECPSVGKININLAASEITAIFDAGERERRVSKGLQEFTIMPESAGIGRATQAGKAFLILWLKTKDPIFLRYATLFAAVLEYFADRKHSMAPTPKVFERIFRQANKVLANNLIIDDRLTMTVIQKYLGDHEWCVKRSTKARPVDTKMCLFQLPADLRKEAIDALESRKTPEGKPVFTIVYSGVGVAVHKAVIAHSKAIIGAAHSVGLKALDMLRANAKALLGDLSDEELVEHANDKYKTLKKANFENIRKMWKETWSNFNKLKPTVVVSEEDKAAKAVADSTLFADLAALTTVLECLNADEVRNLVLADFMFGVAHSGYASVEVNKMGAAASALEGMDLEEAMDKYLKGWGDEELEHVVQIAKSGEYKVDRFDDPISPEKSVVTQLSPIGKICATITGSKKLFQPDGSETWAKVPDHRINGNKLSVWWLEAVESVFGGDLPREPKDIDAAYLLKTFHGPNLKKITVEGVGDLWTMQAPVTKGDQFTFEFRPEDFDGDVNTSVKVEVKQSDEDCNQKASKRLGAVGGSYQYWLNSSYFMYQEMRDKYLFHPAHEGRGFAHPDTVGLDEGLYVCYRQFSKDWGVVKCVLEVHYGVPKDHVFLTPNSFKTKEISVLQESEWAGIGYKHDPLHVRTNKSWLCQEDAVILAAETHIQNIWKRTDEETVDNVVERHLGTVPAIGLMAKIPAIIVGDAENDRECRFDLSFAGVLKVYARCANIFDKQFGRNSVLHITQYGVAIMHHDVYEALSDHCGGADSDDSYTMERVTGGWLFRRDPNIGLEVFFLRENGSYVKTTEADVQSVLEAENAD